ncbi:MAG: hypothetical protein HYY85_19175 [Deltaproteobacteria bacterium]|nr:hypothetical protein [Deltaproteobacteria bacterium]
MMKVAIDKARVAVTARFLTEGSVLAQTVRASCLGFDTRIEVESQEPSERVAGVIRNAENGCFVLQTLLHPVKVDRSFTLNGVAFDPEQHPRPGRPA